jgi:hypothetical protein
MQLSNLLPLAHSLLHGITTLEGLESSLLGLETHGEQPLHGLHAGSMLLTANNATLLGLHQILLHQTSTGLLRGSMVHLGLASNGLHFYSRLT